MDKLILAYRCFVGPQLFRIYRTPEGVGRAYEANGLEHVSNLVLSTAGALKSVCTVLCPVIIGTLYRRGSITVENTIRFGIFLVILYGGCYLSRGLGRLANADYMDFLLTLGHCQQSNTRAAKRALAKYDFEMWAWPADYEWQEVVRGDKIKPRQFVPPKEDLRPIQNAVLKYGLDLICSGAVHTVGRRLLYPGSVALLNAAIHPQLLEGRRKLVEQKRAVRNKLVSRLGDAVDTIFIDQRNNKDSMNGNGNILVIGCEGNAGFYEIGTIGCPLESGYSVLGWNHPGFAQSTGIPWPKNDAASVDVVLQYATNVLGFEESDIIVYAWSIGGFPASWAAMNYPSLRAVVLDATFDDLVPLAVAKMPVSWRRLVHHSVRQHLDLPISAQLSHFPGPVLLIRRSRDEIICTREESAESMLRTNRATQLLNNLLRDRYPNLMAESRADQVLERWLMASEQQRMDLIAEFNIDEEFCVDQLQTAAGGDDGQPIFPMTLGEKLTDEEKLQLIIFLAARYMVDFESSHNAPLPSSMFRQPVHPWQVLID